MGSQAIQKLETDLTSALRGIATKYQQNPSDDDWTKAIKRALCAMGKDKGYGCASALDDPAAKWSEWLFDLCWIAEGKLQKSAPKDGPDWLIERMVLVCESEWSRELHAICADFDKLMVARAELRLMIYQAKTAERVSKIARYLADRVGEYGQGLSGDRYLLAGFNEAEDGQNFDFYRIKVTSEGPTLKRL